MFFMFPFENFSVSSFSPDYRKWESGAIAVSVAVGSAVEKMAASWVASLLSITGRSVASFVASSFMLLLLCFSVPVFCFR